MAVPYAGRIRTDMPRINNPERIGWLPARVVYWLGGGFCAAPILAYLYAAFSAQYTVITVWGSPLLWVAWVAGMVFCLMAAFFRPGGLGAASWAGALADYRLRPRKGQWQ